MCNRKRILSSLPLFTIKENLLLEILERNNLSKEDITNIIKYKNKTVEATVLEHGKAKKILVYKYKAKKNERKTQGHRQPYTKIKIEKISQRASSKKAAATETEAAE